MVPEGPCTNRKRLMKEQLVRGKEFAVQLQSLLLQPLFDHISVSADDLILKILTSFTEALSELTFSDDSLIIGSKDSGSEVRKKDKQVVKNRPRRCCRRKRKALDSCTRETTTTEDGHAWRKYGKKVILNSKYPRCYYRCSFKYDQGCQATKQVERIKEEEPIIYRTTYFGHHICKCSQMTTSGEESKLYSDKSSALDWQDFVPDFSLEGVVSSSDLHGLDMDEISQFGDFHFEALEFS